MAGNWRPEDECMYKKDTEWKETKAEEYALKDICHLRIVLRKLSWQRRKRRSSQKNRGHLRGMWYHRSKGGERVETKEECSDVFGIDETQVR